MPAPKYFRELKAEAEAIHPGPVELQKLRSGHVALILHYRGATRRVFTSATPSDPRTIKNLRTELRHTSRQLIEGKK